MIAPNGVLEGAVRVSGGAISMVASRPPRRSRAIDVGGRLIAPGFIDLHVWGDPERLARELPAQGTTAFLIGIGPEPPKVFRARRRVTGPPSGARCLGAHCEGPFLSPARPGTLPARWMRRPAGADLNAMARLGARIVTLAPERPGALEAIRWLRRRRIVVSLGHSDADAETAERAAAAGARAVTHVFNGMRPFHHRAPGLIDAALADPRLTAMVIADGHHVSASALALLLRQKGWRGTALVTDSVRAVQQAWRLTFNGGVYRDARGVLAGSALAMMRAVRNAVELGGASVEDAVRMAAETPARLLGETRRGAIAPGRRADLVVLDERLRVCLTIIGGEAVYGGV
ncbi:MAG TPA: amidohydrolase family protein [bacterium]